MNRYVFLALLGIVFGDYTNVQAQNGFVVWTKGSSCNGGLMFNRIEDGQVGEEKIAVEKLVTDIWVQISYDGVWIAFCRVNEAFNGRYGACDYHEFDKWDIYIAKIDNGKNLPATPIKVAHGYLPSWGDDAYYPDKPRTLYFTKYDNQTIQKTTINSDGTFTPPVEHARCPKKVQGTSAHTQGSPDGKFILYRPAQMKVYSLELEKDISGSLSGCNPSWGPRSRYFVQAQNQAFLNQGTSVKNLGLSGGGKIWQGISNDSYYDEGKLWVIGAVLVGGGMISNYIVQFSEIDISDDGWKILEPPTKVGIGTSCDIHIWGPGSTPVRSSYSPTAFEMGVEFTARLSGGTAGRELVIESTEPSNSAELYDMKGRQAAFVRMWDKAQTTIPLHGIGNGIYLIQLNTNQGSTRKTIKIIK